MRLIICIILQLLLACGLIDLGMFLTIRFNHYGHIWPDSYAKLSISEYRLYRNQVNTFFPLQILRGKSA